MNALGHAEVEVSGVVTDNSLLKADIGAVNARVRVVAAENCDVCERNGQRGIARFENPGIRWRFAVRRRASEKTARRAAQARAGDAGQLLDAVSGDCAYLSQHVLASVEDAPAGAQCGSTLAGDIPGETDARLEFLLLVVNSAVGRKVRVAQVNSIGGLSGRNHRIGKD